MVDVTRMKVAFLGLGPHGHRDGAEPREAPACSTPVWNRSDGRTAAFAATRACASRPRPPTPRDGADVVILMLADGDVGAGRSAADALGGAGARARVVVDMGTSGPIAERALAAACAERGVGFVDAPVSGSIALAQAATLTALVGGSAEDVERARPALAGDDARPAPPRRGRQPARP